MTPKTKGILTAVLIGMITMFCLAIPLGTIYWFNLNPPLSEVEAVVGRMTMSEAEAARMSQMLLVGSVIDFVLTLIAFVCPAVIIGSLIGLFFGIFKHRRNSETGIDV